MNWHWPARQSNKWIEHYVTTTLLFERSGGYVVLGISLMAKQGSQVLIQHGGGAELATLRGKSLITEDGEAIEGEVLDDVTVIGVVTFTICDVRGDNTVV
ncbi:hypothetical protein [Klebsiella sp. H-Nf2]|uniref:hypothetical protein n=1 Tax=Klebsiella sp. H-Nf2 TaxID=2054599 RepID=UPI001D0D1A9A